MTYQEVSALKTSALAEIHLAKTTDEVEALRIKYVGRNGLLPDLMKGMKDTPPADKPAMGRELNAFTEECRESKRTALGLIMHRRKAK